MLFIFCISGIVPGIHNDNFQLFINFSTIFLCQHIELFFNVLLDISVNHFFVSNVFPKQILVVCFFSSAESSDAECQGEQARNTILP